MTPCHVPSPRLASISCMMRAMALSSLPSRYAIVAVLFLVLLCHCFSFVSSLIVNNFAWRQQRARSNSFVTSGFAATKKDRSKDLKEQVDNPTTTKKHTVQNKKSNAAKVNGAKEAKNGSEATPKRKRTSASTKAKKRTKCQPEEPVYWRNETDFFVLLDQNMTSVTSTEDVHRIHFLIRGNPRPLRRHRTARGFMYNPSSKYQESFRKVVQEMIWSANEEPSPLFTEHDQLAMKLGFHMKRPKIHFVGGKPGPERLRPTAPGRLAPIRTDVDNLAKFVLDSLNGLLYVDDKQVASIHATKLYDSEGHCDGCIEVSIRRLDEENVDDLLFANAFLSSSLLSPHDQ